MSRSTPGKVQRPFRVKAEGERTKTFSSRRGAQDWATKLARLKRGLVVIIEDQTGPIRTVRLTNWGALEWDRRIEATG